MKHATGYSLTMKSKNRKLGSLPAAYAPRATCPNACPLRGAGCYAETGPCSWTWKQARLDFGTFLERVREIPPGTPWRYAIAGDLPGAGDRINAKQLALLDQAAAGTLGWTYTHKPLTPTNLVAIKRVRHLTINISCDTPEKLQLAILAGLPCVVTVPESWAREAPLSVQGEPLRICPSVTHAGVTCARCGACQNAKRAYVIGFPAHGARKRKLSELTAKQWEA